MLRSLRSLGSPVVVSVGHRLPCFSGAPPRGRVHAGTNGDGSAVPCFAIMLPARKSGFRAGFRPASIRESFKIWPPAGRRPAGGFPCWGRRRSDRKSYLQSDRRLPQPRPRHSTAPCHGATPRPWLGEAVVGILFAVLLLKPTGVPKPSQNTRNSPTKPLQIPKTHPKPTKNHPRWVWDGFGMVLVCFCGLWEGLGTRGFQ
jgi:hypothetical protein